MQLLVDEQKDLMNGLLFSSINMASMTSRENHRGLNNSGGVTAFCVPRCYLFPRTLSTSAVCSPFTITINMVAEYEYRTQGEHSVQCSGEQITRRIRNAVTAEHKNNCTKGKVSRTQTRAP